MLRLAATALAVALVAGPAAGQSGTRSLELTSTDGRRQVVAVELTTPLTVDGRLNEEVWSSARPADGFVQAEPLEGQPATEATEVRVAFDRENLYIAALCHDSDPSGPITNEIRKDFVSRDQDTFEVLLDTFADRRNGFVFVTNPAGAKADTQMANEGRDANPDWDAVWWVATQVTAGAWSAEMRIPFKTLRFEPGAERVWGCQLRAPYPAEERDRVLVCPASAHLKPRNSARQLRCRYDGVVPSQRKQNARETPSECHHRDRTSASATNRLRPHAQTSGVAVGRPQDAPYGLHWQRLELRMDATQDVASALLLAGGALPQHQTETIGHVTVPPKAADARDGSKVALTDAGKSSAASRVGKVFVLPLQTRNLAAHVVAQASQIGRVRTYTGS